MLRLTCSLSYCPSPATRSPCISPSTCYVPSTSGPWHMLSPLPRVLFLTPPLLLIPIQSLGLSSNVPSLEKGPWLSKPGQVSLLHPHRPLQFSWENISTILIKSLCNYLFFLYLLLHSLGTPHFLVIPYPQLLAQERVHSRYSTTTCGINMQTIT